MEKEILYTTALDKNGKLIHICNAEKCETYYCPLCRTEFILRKSGKTGKGSKRPHFAHKQPTPNCTPEGVLHYSFKELLVGLLERYKADNKALELNWHCNTCHKRHTGNLLGKAALIKAEYNLKACQPDIAILDAEENVIVVVEIVVTHQPEERVLQYYEENKITLIQINLSSEEDLNNVEKKIANPDIVNYCLNPKCSNHNRHTINRKIYTSLDRCGRCYNPIEKYFIEIDSVFGKQQSLDFTENEIRFVQSRRKHTKVSTNDLNHKYPAPICLKCRVINSRRSRL